MNLWLQKHYVRLYKMITVMLTSVVTALLGTCLSLAILSCSPSWQSWEHSCYRFNVQNDTVNWDDGVSACQAMGGRMAVPRSLDESEFMKQMAQRENIEVFWIGCDDRETGTWDCGEVGEPSLHWGPGQPNNLEGNQHCVVMQTSHSTGYLGDAVCGNRYRALCIRHPSGGSPYTQSLHYCFARDTNGQLLNSCLLNHVIREFVTKSNPRCAVACMKEPACRSFNIKRTDQGQRICQLNDITRYNDPGTLQVTGSLCIYAQECDN
ncbi:lactose-binding lectin l-2-like [Acanthaster planci]|uniref:Lactose-binding lectin l-2-like n=1 Tax=Acanthaster planci TaxID=133434 RepID=A0A8B7YGG5_ACAPL|nr:lactose-binding lectin l-2-like [Acanthaster planci]